MPSSSCRCPRTTRRGCRSACSGRGRTRIGDRAGRFPPPRSDRGSRSSPSRRRRCARTWSSVSHRRRRNHRGDRSGCSARAQTRDPDRETQPVPATTIRSRESIATELARPRNPKPIVTLPPIPNAWIEDAVGVCSGPASRRRPGRRFAPLESIATAEATLPPPRSVVTGPPVPNDGSRPPFGLVAGEREVAVAAALPRDPGGDDSSLGVDRHRADAAGGTEVGLNLTALAERRGRGCRLP